MCWRQHELSTAAVRLLDEERVRRNGPPLFAQATEVELTNVWHIHLYKRQLRIHNQCSMPFVVVK